MLSTVLLIQCQVDRGEDISRNHIIQRIPGAFSRWLQDDHHMV